MTPVFAVPREFGIQSSIESYNNRWQQKVWTRFQFETFKALQEQSERYVNAVRQKCRQRLESAPSRRPFPNDWQDPDLLERKGLIIYIRRTNLSGVLNVLGHDLLVDKHWCGRLVRCEVDLANDVIRAYGLRRKEPKEQPLLKEWPYRMPDKNRKKSPESE